MDVENRCWTEEELLQEHREVLETWPTGADVDLDAAIAYHRQMPSARRFVDALERAAAQGETLVQPRAGTGVLDDHIELLLFLQQEGAADLLPTTIDSYTRQNRYGLAATALERSVAEDRSLLNGLPLVNYGLAAGRRIVESLEVPVQVRHGSADARLLAEIALAGGFSSFEGGGITYNIPYSKDVPVSQSLHTWQYVDRLVGYYEQRGVSIDRESFGVLSGTLVPPSVAIAISVLEALLAVEQGVRHFTVGYSQGGNLVQDLAALHVLRELTAQYLRGRARVSTAFHQYMGLFPRDYDKASALIVYGALVARMAACTKVISKSQAEAHHIPDQESNAAGLRLTKHVLQLTRNQSVPLAGQEYEEESAVIEAQARAILDRVHDLGQGDTAVGTVRAFEAGVIDVPFCPSRFVQNIVLTARDAEGAVRFLKSGNLPFTDQMLVRDRVKMARRRGQLAHMAEYQMILQDIRWAVGEE